MSREKPTTKLFLRRRTGFRSLLLSGLGGIRGFFFFCRLGLLPLGNSFLNRFDTRGSGRVRCWRGLRFGIYSFGSRFLLGFGIRIFLRLCRFFLLCGCACLIRLFRNGRSAFSRFFCFCSLRRCRRFGIGLRFGGYRLLRRSFRCQSFCMLFRYSDFS